MKEYKDLYFEIISKQSSIIEISLTDSNLETFAPSYLFLTDLEKWMYCLGDTNEGLLFKTAIEQYANTLYLLNCGLYRETYITLRFFLEHMLFGLYLSVNELNFGRWCTNKYDMSWSSIVDIDNGIFCKDYFEIFSPSLTEYSRDLLNICKQLYRELSEYTHGNLPATQALPNYIGFDKNSFNDINQKIESIRYLIIFMLFVRYKNRLSKEAIHMLEDSIIDVIGNCAEVQAFFAMNKEST